MKYRDPRQQKQSIVVRPRRKKRFRWAIVLVPAALIAAAWLSQGIVIGFTWVDVMGALHVRNCARYTQLGVLGILCCAGAIIWRLYRTRSTDDVDQR
jgi:hypothetical protein